MKCSVFQVACLLLLAAAVSARELQQDGDVTRASLSAMPMAAVPEAAQPALWNCIEEAGRFCRWGNSTCVKAPVNINNCQVCQPNAFAGPQQPIDWFCVYCLPGYYRTGGGMTCTKCEANNWCGGLKKEACEPGYTAPSGSWAPQNCTKPAK